MDILVENIAPEPMRQPTQASTNPVEHLAIAQRFNIDIPTKDEDAKLQAIWSFVKQQGEERPISDIIWEVINLEQTLGAPKLGQTRLNNLYRYVSLRSQEARIQEQLKDVANPTNIYQ